MEGGIQPDTVPQICGKARSLGACVGVLRALLVLQLPEAALEDAQTLVVGAWAWQAVLVLLYSRILVGRAWVGQGSELPG